MAVKKAQIQRQNAINNKFPRVDFSKKNFDDLIAQKGYLIKVYSATYCPCRRDSTTQALNTCKSCEGKGWLWKTIPIEVLGVISSINLNKTYRYNWSELLIGTAMLTLPQEFQLSYFDKIIMMDSESIYSQLSKKSGVDIGTFHNYPIHYNVTELLDAYIWDEDNKLAIPIDIQNEAEIKINVDGSAILVEKTLFPINSNDQIISVRYKYNPTYLVVELLHDFRNSYAKQKLSKETILKLPVQAMIKQLHLTNLETGIVT